MKTYPPRFGRFVTALAAVSWCLALVLLPTRSHAATLPNVLVNNPAADATARDSQLETTLTLGTGNSIFAAYVDTGSWDGTPGGLDDHLIGLSRSIDGGANWMDEGTLPASILGDGFNPVLARGLGVGALPDSIYLATTDFDPTGGGTRNIQFFRFLDNGMPFVPSFMGMVTAAAGGPGEIVERPSIAVDNFPGVAFGQGMVYLAWRTVLPGGATEIRFAASGDGGNSFDPSVLIATEPPAGNVNGPVVVVGADHAVYVFYLQQTTVDVTPNTIRLRKSINNGMTFAASTPVVTLNPANTARDGDLKLQSGFSGNSFPRAAVNPAFPNHLFVTFNDTGVSAGDKSDVFVLESQNGGATWPFGGRVNDDPGENDQFNPAIAVLFTPPGAPQFVGTRIFIGFYDRRRDTNNILIDTYARIFAGLGTTPNFRITTESFPPVTDQDPGFLNPALADYYVGSYDGAIPDGDSFNYMWSDNRLSNPAAGHNNQPDVRFTKLGFGGPGGMLDLFHEKQVAGMNVGPVAISGGNGDSVIDFNEHNLLSIDLINRGNSNIVGIEATLQSLTPGVQVSPGVSFYPDIAPGDSGTSVMPFSLITPPDFVCGTIIRLQLTVTTFEDGTYVLPFELNTGASGSPVSFVSSDPSIPIPDNDGYRSSTINVSGLTAPIAHMQVRLHILHPRQGDLDISLEGPDGTTIVLSSDNGSAANYGASCPPVPDRAVFNDNGPVEVTQAPPGNFTATTLRPEQRLAAFTGKTGAAANGVWKLKVRDDQSGALGSIECWQLDISTATCVDGGVGVGFLSVANTRVTGGNGNARLDPNECADLTIVLTNIRPQAYVGVSAMLMSQTGVTVVQPNSAYADIPPMEARANLTPFKISISPSIPCGSFVELKLRVSAFNELPFDVPVRLQVGTCVGTEFAATAPQVPLNIPDGPAGCVESIIPVSGLTAPIGKVTVSLGIRHTFVRDLRLTLIAPDGTAVVLADDADTGGDDFGTFSEPFTCATPTTFDDAAGIRLAGGLPPYAGTFEADGPVGTVGPAACASPFVAAAPQPTSRPLFAFSGLSGAAANGNWRLRVQDQANLDVGVLVCWSLRICEAEQFTPVFGSIPGRIDDLSTNDIAIPVSGIVGSLNKVRVAMRVRHTFVGDLQISITSPDGTTVDLSSDNGGGNDNYGLNCASPTVFDDDAGTAITAAPSATPFANGTFRPEQPLSAFAGKSGTQVNGTWIVRFADHVPIDEGQVDCLLLDLFPAECTDGGGVCPPNRVLTVTAANSGGSVPIIVSLADINMDQNGSTTFTRTYAHGVSVDLTAPPTSPNGNTFVRWRIGAADQPLGQDTITVNLVGDRTATAVYSGPTTLTVASTPLSGVPILVSPADNNALSDGVTTFTRLYDPLTTVTLTAPAMSPAGGTFVRWRVDGVDQAAGVDTVSVAMDANHTATAVYVGPSILTVLSLNPNSGVGVAVNPPDLGGDANGTTPFTRRYIFPGAIPVQLTADAVAPNGFTFLRWRIDGVSQTAGVNPITVIMSANHTVIAEYERPTRLLRVESDDPDSGVPIEVTPTDVHGLNNGITTFTREYNKNTVVTLTAPLTEPGSGRLFKKWEIDDDSQPQGQNTIIIVMNADRVVEAKYMSATVELEVDSEDPDSGVDITVLTPDNFGRTSGTTEFTREYNRYSTVTLIAPPVAGGRLFKRWEIDDDDQPTGQRVISVFMDEDIEVDAEYGDAVPAGGTSFALWFDAFNDQVRVPDSPSLRITGPITVEAWIRRDIGNREQTIVEKSGCIGEALLVGGYSLSVNAANKLVFQTKDHCAQLSTVTGASSLQPNTWYHVAGVWNGTHSQVYIQGILDGIAPSLSNPEAGNTPLLIGASGNIAPFNVMAGFIDEVRIWAVARTAAELSANASACLTGSQPGLAGYWRLNEDSGLVAHDSSINGNNGLLVNGPLWVGSPVGCTTLPSPFPIVLPRPAPAPPVALRVEMLNDMTDHACHLIVNGPAGQMVTVETSNDMQSWAPLVCSTNVTGSFKVSDPMNPGVSKRFFRVRQEP